MSQPTHGPNFFPGQGSPESGYLGQYKLDMGQARRATEAFSSTNEFPVRGTQLDTGLRPLPRQRVSQESCTANIQTPRAGSGSSGHFLERWGESRVHQGQQLSVPPSPQAPGRTAGQVHQAPSTKAVGVLRDSPSVTSPGTRAAQELSRGSS